MRLRPLVAAVVAALALAACSPAGSDDAPAADGVTTVTVRLWDEQVAAAYEESFAEFSRQNPDVRVQLNLVPWSDYFTGLPLTSPAAPPRTSTGSTAPTSGRSPTAAS